MKFPRLFTAMAMLLAMVVAGCGQLATVSAPAATSATTSSINGPIVASAEFSGRSDHVVLGNASIVGTPGNYCLLYTSPSPRDQRGSRMPSSA